MIPWIQIYSNLVTHPKTARLAKDLKLQSSFTSPAVTAAGILVAIWTWAIQNAPDGDLSDAPTETIYVCADCKKPVTDYTASNGVTLSAEEIAEHSKAEHGVYLCTACLKQRNKVPANG